MKIDIIPPAFVKKPRKLVLWLENTIIKAHMHYGKKKLCWY